MRTKKGNWVFFPICGVSWPQKHTDLPFPSTGSIRKGWFSTSPKVMVNPFYFQLRMLLIYGWPIKFHQQIWNQIEHLVPIPFAGHMPFELCRCKGPILDPFDTHTIYSMGLTHLPPWFWILWRVILYQNSPPQSNLGKYRKIPKAKRAHLAAKWRTETQRWVWNESLKDIDTHPCLLVFHLRHMQKFFTPQWCFRVTADRG